MNAATLECGEVPQRSDNDDSPAGVLREIWQYRELFYFLAWRDVKVRYKQTALGALWAVIQPFFTMIVFTLLFGRLADIPSDGVPRPLFYFAALVPWTYLSSTVNTAGMSLVANSTLLSKIYFPRIILPSSAALSGLLDFFIASTFLGGFLLYYRIPPGWNLLLWPLLVALLVVLSLGVGMFLAALNVRFRDVKYAIPFVIQIWLFVSPIIYPSSMVPERYRWLLALNPLSGLIEGFRYALVPAVPIHWNLLGVSAVISSLLFIGGLAYFRRTEGAFADII